ncbi:MAG TPA: TonB-dependent receptor [Vicinamibacteria bacterium]
MKTIPFLAAAWLAAATAVAAENGRLRGTVTDETDHALPGVRLEVQGEAPAVARQALTDAQGRFELADVPAGRYSLDFRLPAFATSVRTVTVEAGGTTEVDAVLRLSLTAQVLVTERRTFRSLTDLDEPVGGLLGLAGAGSEGVVSAARIEQRPIDRAGEVYESVPGVVVSQHSGDGKANQYYVRGFNVDHGTDLATAVAGVPVNLPTHAHGQGYSDNNFLIPELVSGVQYRKGTYDAQDGDFSAAGSISVNYLSVLDRPLLKLEAGANTFLRGLFAASSRVGGGHLLYAAEACHDDGPWVSPDDLRKWNGVLRFSRGDQRNGFSLTATGYRAEWSSTDQVPRRAVESGLLDRFGAVDGSDAGETHRLALAGEWRRSGRAGLTVVKAFALDYGLDLFSNFTYFLDDPENGDQFEQRDERTVFGATASQRFLGGWLGRDVESVAGLQVRRDRIPTVGLYHTVGRRRLETIREDDVTQASGSAYFQSSVQWTPRVRTTLGLRGDLYHFDVESSDPANSGARTASLASPKLGLVLGPFRNSELYANWGWGFHSNDARGSVQTRDPGTGAAVEPVDPLVRARGVEVGFRTVVPGRYSTTLVFWGLDIASELLFVGDAGTTETSRPSRRLGVEWSNVLDLGRRLTADADLAWSRARFRDHHPAGRRIPGAVEGVASAGLAVHDLGGWSGSLRLRWFGPRPLTEDDRVRSEASVTLDARATWRLDRRLTLNLDVFNLTDAQASDVDYFYASRLPGEPPQGVEDLHTHPLEPRSFRASLSATF